jgi:hypothetical protein
MLFKGKIRGQDTWGSGDYGAPRGNHKHRGVDFECAKQMTVLSLKRGFVTKWGFPYNRDDTKKAHFRYIEIEGFADVKIRYFYVFPYVKPGDQVDVFQEIGMQQHLGGVWPGITEHIHIEVIVHGERIDPKEYLLS